MSDLENTDMDVDPEFEVVAAIDFGTTYSGYAYSMTDDYKKDKLNISSATWKSATMISPKTPTSVLLDSDKALVAFGYDAESEYTLLAEKNEHEDFYYFRRFKMELFNEIRDSVSIAFLCIITIKHSCNEVPRTNNFDSYYKSTCILLLQLRGNKTDFVVSIHSL